MVFNFDIQVLNTLLALMAGVFEFAINLISTDVILRASESGFDNRQIGSVGTLIGAALETTGQYLQSSMLDHFNNGYANSIGALMYIIGALAAIFIVGIGGNYKFGLWFLIGPSLFWWMTTHRVETYGANWEFGTTAYQSDEIFRVTGSVIFEQGPDEEDQVEVQLREETQLESSTGRIPLDIDALGFR